MFAIKKTFGPTVTDTAAREMIHTGLDKIWMTAAKSIGGKVSVFPRREY